ncbi:DUF805 domain-containing protein [Pelagicoccus sp. SDUM812003]|uniref:DUF805 domain-containing protein n=1 Tax=Pelagicoccus sp. SDUM812003 TaxID=3041267 RepID=UPI00280EE339|nr:DUF805 domain-containing protein [Pelagicoccus sp. SDUM812003]MDQ8205829.1 DUF805 domain-containing protein [Pelagicoccus sp. SDUM812003]
MNESVYSFKGRLRRSDFLKINILLVVFIGVIQSLLIAILPEVLPPNKLIAARLLSSSLIVLFLISAIIPLSVRRLHDLNKPGIMVGLKLIPILNIYLFILLFFVKGTNGSNKYGDEKIKKSKEPERILLSHERFNFTEHYSKKDNIQ